MPIDFAAIAARLAGLAYQDRLSTDAGKVIQDALEKRLSGAHTAEVNTGDLPTLRFEDGALAVRVLAAATEGTAAILLGVGELSKDTVGLGVSGWNRWLHAATDLPTMIDAVDQLVASAEASIARLATPTPQTFDPRGATIFDVVGVAAATYAGLKRALQPGGDADRIHQAVADAAKTLGLGGTQPPNAMAAPIPSGAFPVAPVPAPPEPAGTDDDDAPILAATVMLLAWPRLVGLVAEAVGIRARLGVLEVLVTVEQAVRSAIAMVYDKVFTTIGELGLRLTQIVRGIQVVVGAFARGAIAFALAFGIGFGSAVTDFVFQLAGFLKTVAVFMQILVDVLETLGLDRWARSDIPIPAEAPRLDFHSDLIDIGSSLFGDEVQRQVGDVIAKTDDAMRAALEAGFSSTARQLDARARQFSSLADTAGDTGPLTPQLGGDADQLAAALFPTEPVALERDPLAQAFDACMAHGGIDILEGVTRGYGQQMARLWRARYLEEPVPGGPGPDGGAPTSPHILRKHTVAVRVQVPRVVVRISGDPDGVLDAVAGEFAGAVRDAYRNGTRMHLAGAGGATWTR